MKITTTFARALFACALSLCVGVACAEDADAEGEKTVTVEGYVYSNGMPVSTVMVDLARDQARRRAIEMGGETVIERQTGVENFELVKDVILTDTRGLLKSQEWIKYKNGKDYQEKDGRLFVKLKAVVKIGRIESDIPAITELLAQKGNPRLAVLVRQETGTGIDAGLVAGEINSILIDRRFNVMDYETAMEAIGREADVMFDTPEKAALLAQRLPVDFIIVGDVKAESAEPFEEGGEELHRHNVSIRFSIIDKHLGRLVGVVQRSFYTKSALPASAGKRLQDALAATGKNVAEEVLTLLLNYFGYKTSHMELLFTNSTRAKLDKLRTALKDGLGGKQVFTIRSVRRGDAVVDFESQFIPDRVASFLEEQEEVPVFVNDQTESKLYCEIK